MVLKCMYIYIFNTKQNCEFVVLFSLYYPKPNSIVIIFDEEKYDGLFV